MASAASPPTALLDENDLVSINYTSGTTARPKGVMLTHRNCYLNAYNLIAHLGIRHDDVELWTLPMFHCNGWGGVYALTGMGGTHVVLRTVEGERIYQLLAQEKVTFACMAPAVLRTILDFEDKGSYDIRTRPRFVMGGAPPPAASVTSVLAADSYRQYRALTPLNQGNSSNPYILENKGARGRSARKEGLST